MAWHGMAGIHLVSKMAFTSIKPICHPRTSEKRAGGVWLRRADGRSLTEESRWQAAVAAVER